MQPCVFTAIVRLTASLPVQRRTKKCSVSRNLVREIGLFPASFILSMSLEMFR